ncbi:expressed unknown protein [Seminavis robusta]|uniref:Uncharacterized protein n=1 Tax=Seminavis robusta TaxID=568900 RepID=A0A9N8EAF7_9STRA|nr:expressed unknown protein [Seminavis robusta]|eukprot:Sro727_g193580.1 n/a (245) ;mRNA; f:14443-15177
MLPQTTSLALALNQQAVNMMSVGKFSNAIRLLTRSLKEVKREIADDTSDKTSITCLDNGDHLRFGFTEEEAGVDDKTTIPRDFGSFRASTIFDRPISVSHDPSAAVCGFTSLARFTNALVYNLGLAFQLLAVQKQEDMGEPARKHLEKALKFYQMAYTMVVSDGQASGGCTLLQQMAILNNLGIVLQALGEPEKAKQCFQSLLQLAMLAMSREEPEVSQLHFDLFFRNIQSVILRDNLKSAHAA